MKTAMQELVSKLNNIHTDEAPCEYSDEYKLAINRCRTLATELLEQERKQVIDAFNQGYREGEEGNSLAKSLVDVSQFEDANNYFNNTYATRINQ